MMEEKTVKAVRVSDLNNLLDSQLSLFKWFRFMLIIIFILTLTNSYAWNKKVNMLIEHNYKLERQIRELNADISAIDLTPKQDEFYIFNVEKPIAQVETVKQQLFTVTAYDNSAASQGAYVGQTATGFKLTGHTRESAKCIAVDPKTIPLGSKVEVIFPAPYESFSGVYIARDTGGVIKGNKIDLFMGDGVNPKDVKAFGVRKALIRVLD